MKAVRCKSELCPADGSCYLSGDEYGQHIMIVCVLAPKNYAFLVPPNTYEVIDDGS